MHPCVNGVLQLYRGLEVQRFAAVNNHWTGLVDWIGGSISSTVEQIGGRGICILIPA